MHIAVKRLLAAFLRPMIRILPDPDGKPREVHPRSPGMLAGLRETRDNFTRRRNQLNYSLTKNELWRIFHLNSSVYIEEPTSSGFRIRAQAGYSGSLSAHDEVHGSGYTKVIFHRDTNLYANMMKLGIGFDSKNRFPNINKMLMEGLQTLKNLPLVVARKKTPNALLATALAVDPPSHRCQLSIVAEQKGGPQAERLAYFGLRADYMDIEDETVTLRGIFMPVANPDGTISGNRTISAKTPNANIETLRALIAFKLVADRLAYNNPADMAACIKAAEALPLTEKSTLREYLTYDFEH